MRNSEEKIRAGLNSLGPKCELGSLSGCSELGGCIGYQLKDAVVVPAWTHDEQKPWTGNFDINRFLDFAMPLLQYSALGIRYCFECSGS
jgi:hypothetical protein